MRIDAEHLRDLDQLDDIEPPLATFVFGDERLRPAELVGDLLLGEAGIPAGGIVTLTRSSLSCSVSECTPYTGREVFYYGDVEAYQRWAEAGIAWRQHNLAFLYEKGWGVPQDYVLAHKWYSIAAATHPPGKSRNHSVKEREKIAKPLSDEQIAEAKRMAREWLEEHGVERSSEDAAALSREDEEEVLAHYLSRSADDEEDDIEAERIARLMVKARTPAEQEVAIAEITEYVLHGPDDESFDAPQGRVDEPDPQHGTTRDANIEQMLLELIGDENIRPDTKEELRGYLGDYRAGRLDADDERYVIALYERLKGPR